MSEPCLTKARAKSGERFPETTFTARGGRFEIDHTVEKAANKSSLRQIIRPDFPMPRLKNLDMRRSMTRDGRAGLDRQFFPVNSVPCVIRDHRKGVREVLRSNRDPC